MSKSYKPPSLEQRKLALLKARQKVLKTLGRDAYSKSGTEALETPSLWASTGSFSLDRILRGFNPGGVPVGPKFGRIVHIAGDWSTGKALSVDQEVVTPSGLKRAGDVRAQSFLIGLDGKPTKVKSVFPQGTRALYRVTFTDGSSALVDEEHLWAVKTQNVLARERRTGEEKPWLVLTTRAILDAGLRNTKRAGSTTSKWVVPNCQPVQFNSRSLPLAPYLLGVWLGDGSRNSPSWTKPVVSIAQKVETLLPSGVTLQKLTGDGRYSIVGPRGKTNPVSTALKRLGLFDKYSYERFIPEPYLYASVQDRLALLQGLMDTDSYVGKDGVYTSFSSSSSQLARDFLFLVRSLGGRGFFSQASKGYKKDGVWIECKDAHTICFSLPSGMSCVGHNPRKKSRLRERNRRDLRRIQSIEFERMGDAVCFVVDAEDSLFLLKDFIPTHNSLILDHLFKSVQDMGGFCLCSETEASRDPHFAEAIGLSLDELEIQRPETIETAFDAGIAWHDAIREQFPNAPILWGIDSIDSVEAGKSAGTGLSEGRGWMYGGGKSEAFGVGLRRINARLCGQYPTTLVLLNQVRISPGVMFGPKKYTPGGQAPHFYASIELMLSIAPPPLGDLRSPNPVQLTQEQRKRLGLTKTDKGSVVGRWVRAKVTKTKVGGTLFEEADFLINFTTGIVPYAGLINRLMVEGVCRERGDGIIQTLPDGSEQSFATRAEWARWVKANPKALMVSKSDIKKSS